MDKALPKEFQGRGRDADPFRITELLADNPDLCSLVYPEHVDHSQFLRQSSPPNIIGMQQSFLVWRREILAQGGFVAFFKGGR